MCIMCNPFNLQSAIFRLQIIHSSSIQMSAINVARNKWIKDSATYPIPHKTEGDYFKKWGLTMDWTYVDMAATSML